LERRPRARRFNGEFISVDVPFIGAGATWITGIDKYPEIVGQYIDTAGRIYGFTAKIAR
jgi:hypothetical protein